MKVRRSGEDGGVPCSECGSGGDGANMLLCDNCDAGWHLYCLPSPLARVPDGDWTCPACDSSDSGASDDDSPDVDDDRSCEECGTKDSEVQNEMLLCDGPDCSSAWHLLCLPIPLASVPEGLWLCPECSED